MELQEIAKRLGVNESDAQALLTKNNLNAESINDAQLIALKRSLSTQLATQSPAQAETKPAAKKGGKRGRNSAASNAAIEQAATNAQQSQSELAAAVNQHVQGIVDDVKEAVTVINTANKAAAALLTETIVDSHSVIAQMTLGNLESYQGAGKIGFAEAVKGAVKSVPFAEEQNTQGN